MFDLTSVYLYIGAFILKNAIWWYPVLVLALLPRVYMAYIRARWIKNLNWFFIEIKFPKEILKSPKAMEVILSQLHQKSKGSLTDQYIKGKVPSWFSLEIASLGGDIHFFIRGEAKFKKLTESIIYSQYPGVEIYDAEDYTAKVPYNIPGSDWDIFGLEFGLTKTDVYPIKTYVDYGLDKDPKEEFKVDPLTSVLEFFGSVEKTGQVWLQIPIMASRKDIKGQVKAEVDKIKKGDGKEPNQFGVFSLMPNEREIIEAIQRAAGKYCFDTGYRMIYLARKGDFVGVNISRMISSAQQYGSELLNGLKPIFFTSFDYPWQDFRKMRANKRKKDIFDNYRRRAYFYPPAKSKNFLLSTEELATIYHFPGKTAETPNLERIISKRGEPPANLPIE